MSEQSLLIISVLTLFLPLIGFATLIFFGKKIPKLYLLEVGILFTALVFSGLIAYFKLGLYAEKDLIFSFTWIDFGRVFNAGDFFVELGIKIDNLTAIMLIVVNLISFLVHLFSLEYMKGDIRYTRYFAYLGIFTFSMLGIVLTHNILMMYIFWELVGLSSYLLIGFWFEKKSAADAGKKAFLVNRVGDLGMFIGILILFTTYGTFTFDTIFEQISQGVLPFGTTAGLTAAGILVFMGAVGKSAQFPLHVWLPDAMEGPTPVSALIHAATMVAAGVYLVARIFVMLTADALLVIAIIGAVTSFIAATIAITQNDIKRVLAYSTVSQLGYMVMAVGVGAYTYAFFHLVTHAFFKACLFLGSGSVINAMHHTQNINEMGGLRKKMPITYISFLISTLAISGVPFTSGFLSKDGILAGTLIFGKLTGHWIIPVLGFVVAFMTAFYMFRLVILTFHGKPRNKEKYEHAHEQRWVMTVPLIVLSGLSVFFWYTPNPVNPESGWFLSNWVTTPSPIVPDEARFDFMKSEQVGYEEALEEAEETTVHSSTYMHAKHAMHYPAMFLSLILAGLGIFLAYFIYQWKKTDPDKLAEKFKPLYKLSFNKWYVDEIYDATLISGTLKSGAGLSFFDNKIVDGIVNGAATVTRGFSKVNSWFDTYVVDGLVNFTAFLSGIIGLSFRKVQTGRIQTYVLYVVVSVVALFVVFSIF